MESHTHTHTTHHVPQKRKALDFTFDTTDWESKDLDELNIDDLKVSGAGGI